MFLCQNSFSPPLCMCLFLKKKKKNQSVHLILFSPLRSYSVHSVHIDLIRSILVIFCPLWSYSVHIGPIWSIICPIQSIMSTSIHLVLFGLFCPLWFYSVQYVHFGPIWSFFIHFVHSILIRSHSVLFNPSCLYFVLFCPSGPLCSIRSNSVHLITLILFCPLQSIFVHLQNGKRHIWVERKTSFLYNQYNFYLLSL